MSTIKELVEYQQRFIDETMKVIKDFETHHYRLTGRPDGPKVDVTDEWAEMLLSQLAKAEEFIAAVKKRHPEEFM